MLYKRCLFDVRLYAIQCYPPKIKKKAVKMALILRLLPLLLLDQDAQERGERHCVLGLDAGTNPEDARPH